MELKTKSIKRTLLIFGGVILICFTTLMLHSCSNEDSSIKANTTEADKTSALVNSSEFNSLNESAKNLGAEVRANYLKLSKPNQELFINQLEQVKNAKDIGEAQSLIQSAGSLIKIDILNKVDSLNKQSSLLKAKGFFDDVNKRTLVSALSRSLLTKSSSTRFKVAAESTPGSHDIECMVNYTVALSECNSSDVNDPCKLAAYAQFLICMSSEPAK